MCFNEHVFRNTRYTFKGIDILREITQKEIFVVEQQNEIMGFRGLRDSF